MNFEDLRLRTLEDHVDYIKHELEGGKYAIKISYTGAYFYEVVPGQKSEPLPCMHGWFVNPDMFLAAVRQLETEGGLVGIAGLKRVVAGATLWYCLELPKAQAANAA